MSTAPKRSILTLALAATMMLLVLAVPAMANGGDVTIAYGTPKIDAVVDDVWAKTPGYATPNSYNGAPITSDTSAEWKFLWDEEYIYVLCVIQDSQLTANSTTYWQNDDTQLFIDFLNSSDFANASYSEFGTALGIRYCWEGGVLPPPDNFVIKENSSAYQYEEGEEEYDFAAHAQATTETGYIVEYRIKPTLFCDSFKMETGQQGGIDFVNDDSMTGSNTRNNLFMYSVHGNTWNKPTYLSTFTLAAKDGVIDLEAAAAEKAAKEAAAEEKRAAEEAARILEEERLAQKTNGVQVVYGTPVVDGDIDDVWASVPGYKTTHVHQKTEIKAPIDAEWKVMWDENRFYVLANIKDDQLDAMNTTLWKNDNTQFVIDFGHGHDFAANNYDGDPSALIIQQCWLGGVLQMPDAMNLKPMGGTAAEKDSDAFKNIITAQKDVEGGFVNFLCS